MTRVHSPCRPALAAALAVAAVLLPAAGADADPELLLEGRPVPGGGDVEPPGDGAADERRARMVDTHVAGRGVSAGPVLEAMRRVPRHAFVPAAQRGRAYADRPLPIGHGQTISQPFIVGFMTQTLEPDADDRVLEVGTGSGYQAAVLAELVREVVSIEIVRALATAAAGQLERLGYRNVSVLHGDGYYGWQASAPYDAIVVTAAASHVPPPLVAQLRPGGRMVVPVDAGGRTQNLLLIEKDAHGEITTRNLMAVRFVPLTGEH